MLSVKSVSYLGNYKIKIHLSNERYGVFDLSPYLEKGIFRQLKDEEYLKQVKPNFVGICWPNGQDFSADTLDCEMQTFDEVNESEIASIGS